MAPSASASGVSRPAGTSSTALPVGDLPGWHQIFTDDFSTDVPLGKFPAAVANKWDAYPSPWKDSMKHGVYSPSDVVSVSNGVLNEHIHTKDGVHKIAALLPKVPRGQLYGRYAVRWRADDLPGYKVAWLLWPDSNTWPRDGEIDFGEMNLDTQAVGAFVHRQGATLGSDQAAFKVPMDPNQWHTTVIEWAPNLVVFQLDGVEIGRTTTRIPNTPMHLVLQTETKISSKSPADSVAGNVQIDWVSMWGYGDAPKPVAPKPAAPVSSVSLAAPSADATVSGNVDLGSTATDPAGITAVKWYVDGKEVGYSAQGAPWQDAWNSTTVGDGQHKVFTKARTGNGTWLTSTVKTITVKNH